MEDNRQNVAFLGDTVETLGEFQGFSSDKGKNKENERHFKNPEESQGKEECHMKKKKKMEKPIPFQEGGFHLISVPEVIKTRNRKNKGLPADRKIYIRERENENMALKMTSSQSTSILSQEQIPSGKEIYNYLESGKSFCQRIAGAAHQRIPLGDHKKEHDEELHKISSDKAKHEEIQGNLRN